MTLSEESIQTFLDDHFQEESVLITNADTVSKDNWTKFVEKYHTADFQYIRPNGLPADRNALMTMITSGIINKDCKESLISVDSVKLLAGGAAAVVTYTTDQYYTIRGKRTAERATMSAVVVLENGVPKFTQSQRCLGRPIPKVAYRAQ